MFWPRTRKLLKRGTEPLQSAAGRMAIHRMLIAIPVLLGITVLTFFVLDVLPGSAAQQLLGADATPEQVAQLESKMGLDKPAWWRYVHWLQGVVAGDLGRSIASGQAVSTLISGRLLVTLELIGLAFVLSVGLAVPVALLAAHRRYQLTDRLTMLISMGGLSAPSYVVALVLVLLFSVRLPLFPSIGFTPPSESLLENLRSLTLPAIAIALPLFCFYTRILHNDLVEQMQGQDYVVTAAAKGVSPGRVLVNHAFRNSVFGLLTLIGMHFGSLIGGTVVIEQIFGLPGIGQLLIQSINIRDAAVVQALVLLAAVATVFANLCVDLLYGVLDPRVRYGHE